MDWKKIIAELQQTGVTQTEMAEACNCGQSTISELLNGEIKSPSYALGACLIELHTREVSPGDTA